MRTVTLVDRKDIYLEKDRNLPLDKIELEHILINVERKAFSDEVRFVDGDGKEKTLK